MNPQPSSNDIIWTLGSLTPAESTPLHSSTGLVTPPDDVPAGRCAAPSPLPGPAPGPPLRLRPVTGQAFKLSCSSRVIRPYRYSFRRLHRVRPAAAAVFPTDSVPFPEPPLRTRPRACPRAGRGCVPISWPCCLGISRCIRRPWRDGGWRQRAFVSIGLYFLRTALPSLPAT